MKYVYVRRWEEVIGGVIYGESHRRERNFSTGSIRELDSEGEMVVRIQTFNTLWWHRATRMQWEVQVGARFFEDATTVQVFSPVLLYHRVNLYNTSTYSSALHSTQTLSH